ncbi:glycoside hydrolase [Shewanella xiamenensis]|uniref:Glycoside hydrolase n=1 Tax=Shewanella xiamenensis TaxID=332186 RepID=A0ABT6U9X2_9GAMM|nr:glycoside hydrolase [Shewanella xiamenensis]MBW0294772.1 glycoside hydrolase [Shewanella xiamenensis]MDI5831151.1 glycoside hydrolase [Shewanella xiamenensis]UML94959.1 glycoside hydrolase [Shewanella xiamenensis]
MPKVQPVALYTVFHLNLAFSSIENEQHAAVIRKCYWPLLQIAQKGIPVGIEMTAYTLEAVQQVDPLWVQEFKLLLQQGMCELIASGDSQIIGPLVPAKVNQANLRLGQDTYHTLLGVRPQIAYINEQAVSAGLLDVYIDQGFEAVVVEWDNPYSHNPNWSNTLLDRPQSLQAASGRTIKVIWNHAIAFQKFQRYVHGELTLEDYLHYLVKIFKPGMLAFPVYGSDAEVFDFRPGRYQTEADHVEGEWQRISTLFNTLAGMDNYCWQLPQHILKFWQESNAVEITNAEHPVSVKKQAKYNVSRWGLSGRNDLLLNSLCYQLFTTLAHNPHATEQDWRNLCRMWASDLRTHITAKRYQQLNLVANPANAPVFAPWEAQEDIQIEYDTQRRRLHIRTPKVHLSLNGNRGLAIDKLAFKSHAFEPVLGTLSHGFFDHISYGADFYSNHLLMERFRARDRVTDLNRVNYELGCAEGNLVIYCRQSLKSGAIIKWYRIEHESLHTGLFFEDKQRPEASIRLSYLTLLGCDNRAWYQTNLGGEQEEFFQIQEDMDQGSPVSSIVSANSAIGATAGQIRFGSGQCGVRLTWDPANCAALPMISSKKIDDKYLNRLWFSLAEADETLKEGGNLLDFNLCITPESINL